MDTNVLSEATRPMPDRGVEGWLRAAQDADLGVSVVTFGEIARGIEQLPVSQRRVRLSGWLDRLLRDFEGRALAVDTQVALEWGRLFGRAQTAGRPLQIADSLIAATALVHGLAVVTRNVSDFEACGVEVVNPWTGAAG